MPHAIVVTRPFWENTSFSRIHQQKTSCSICIFRISASKQVCPKALTADPLLNGNLAAQKKRIRLPIHPQLEGIGLGSIPRGISSSFKISSSIQRINIKQQCSGCIGIIGNMYSALGQFPDQPGLHRFQNSRSPLSALSLAPGT